MKKVKKIFAVVATSVMVLSTGLVSVNAAEAQARLPLCPRGGTLVPYKSYGEWYVYQSKHCVHGYSFGEDKYFKSGIVKKSVVV